MRVAQFEHNVANRAPEREVGVQDALPIAIENSKDSFDGIDNTVENGLHDLGLQVLRVPVEHRKEQIFLGGEEVIETAAIDTRRLEDLRDPSLAVPLLPKE